jgi:aspartokinase/homoserine dehydrogenase 1
MEKITSWIVHKFGGTSVGSANAMRQCIEIVRPDCYQERVAVVVSAIGGKPKITDLLLDLVHAAANLRIEEIEQKKNLIMLRHEDCISSLLIEVPDVAERIRSQIISDLQDISDILRAVQLMRNPHEQILELVSGYGELWSARIMTEAMRQSGLPFVFVNARDVLYVSEQENIGTQVLWEESEKKLKQFLSQTEKEFAESIIGKQFQREFDEVRLPHLMITGYIASTIDGVATTLKRDGSDFSASIFGKMLNAKSITIWTDVSGVYSADPRRVPEAQIIPTVSYSEAIEMAYFGAKVIHPKT